MGAVRGHRGWFAIGASDRDHPWQAEHAARLYARKTIAMATKTPTIIWAQRVEKVFITWEMLSTKDVNVTLAEGLLSIEGKDGKGDLYKLENLPLFLEIEPEESKWFKNDR